MDSLEPCWEGVLGSQTQTWMVTEGAGHAELGGQQWTPQHCHGSPCPTFPSLFDGHFFVLTQRIDYLIPWSTREAEEPLRQSVAPTPQEGQHLSCPPSLARAKCLWPLVQGQKSWGACESLGQAGLRRWWGKAFRPYCRMLQGVVVLLLVGQLRGQGAGTRKTESILQD